MLLKNIEEDKINSNWDTFKELLRRVNRDGIEDLISYLEKTDFAVSPASTKYHGSFKGGLCEHSLAVFEILNRLNLMYQELYGESLNTESIIITSLLHDISKVNTYEEFFQNKKVYSESGSKFDEGGKFDWVSVKIYKTKDLEDRFVFVNHESTSEFIVRQFIDLTIEESVAIMTHHNGMGYDSIPKDVTSANLSKYPLALLLHEADLMAAYTWA